MSLIKGITIDAASKYLGAASVAYSTVKLIDHPNWNDGTDAVVGGIVLATGPVGWIIGGAYFLGNIISENVGSHETLGERLGGFWDSITN